MSRIFSSAEPGPQLTWTAMMKDPAFAQTARREKNTFDKDDLLTFLIAKDHYITLKRMGDAVRECQNSELSTHAQFQEHVNSVAPRLFEESANIRDLAELRDPPSHASTLSTHQDALDAARLCVHLVSCLARN